MAHIVFEKSGFVGAEQLATFLENRMAQVSWHDAQQAPQKGSGKPPADAEAPLSAGADAYVCSKEFAVQAGGVSGIAEIARNMKASRVMVISTDTQRDFEMRSEMRGNLIFLNLARSDTEPKKLNSPQNFSLHMAVTRLLDSDHVAVSDPKSLELMSLARRVSKTDVTVFINGPTGTGKEVLSKFIHNQSGRHGAPFVAVNCAAIPENMLEAILFGHEKGAFTGASTANKGISELLMEGHYCLMRFQKCLLVFRPNFCGRFRSAELLRSEASAKSRSMSALLQRPTVRCCQR